MAKKKLKKRGQKLSDKPTTRKQADVKTDSSIKVSKPKKGIKEVRKVSKEKVSKPQEQQVEEHLALNRGTEIVGHTESFVLVRFPDTTKGEGQYYYNVVDKVKAFCWASTSEGLKSLKYIDTKYGQSDTVFRTNLNTLVESDYHIKCTLQGRNSLLKLFEKTDFDKVEFYHFPIEHKEEKKKTRKRINKKKVEKVDEQPEKKSRHIIRKKAEKETTRKDRKIRKKRK
jgi:hypothetical protein